jgi:diadenosine tetraphosphate (Ap4A) HIT family hydrolase
MAEFLLHPRLVADCISLGRMDLSRLLLMNDAQYPWFILVPELPGLTELYQLGESERARLWQESARLSRALVTLFTPDKLNVASLGNQVPQLHVHHIARRRDDPAWPDPVWGKRPSQPYSPEQRAALIDRVRGALESFGA